MSLIRIAMLVALALALTAVSSRAANDFENGVAGTAGNNGASGNPGQSGDVGSPGQPANADAGFTVANSDSTNLAIAKGGKGGNGGAGGNGTGTNASGGKGGDGAAGGIASAKASTTVTSGDATATAQATGGAGGDGSAGGTATGSGSSGAGGNGGNGGNATATSFADDADPTGSVSSSTTAIGGTGGAGMSAGQHGGNGGSASALASATSTGNQSITIIEKETGGSGGIGLNGANGGNGADAIMINQASASTAGSIILDQEAIAGQGGNAIGGGTFGLTGNALSNITFNDAAHTNAIQATVLAGGRSATANLNIASGGDITETVSAAGTTVATSAAATTTGAASQVSVTISASGGNGAAGVDTNLTNAADANGPAGSTLLVAQIASGAGAQTTTPGNATASLTLSKNVSSLTVNDEADGALAGDFQATDNSGNGTASSRATNAGGVAIANALATGGSVNANAFASSTLAGSSSSTNALADAFHFSGSSSARSNNVGFGGTAHASSDMTNAGSAAAQSLTQNAGMLVSLKAVTSSPSLTNAVVNALTVTSATGGAPSLDGILGSNVAFNTPSLQSVALGEALPTAGEAATALSGHSNVTSAMTGPGQSSNFLGISALAVANPGVFLQAQSDTTTETASTEYVFDTGQLASPGELKVGLLDFSAWKNPGFQSLEFTLFVNGNMIGETFDNPADAEAFFQDNVLDLGPILSNVGANGRLDITFELQVQTLNNGDSFAADLIFANVTVPEPAAIGVMAMLAMLLRRSRRQEN